MLRGIDRATLTPRYLFLAIAALSLVLFLFVFYQKEYFEPSKMAESTKDASEALRYTQPRETNATTITPGLSPRLPSLESKPNRRVHVFYYPWYGNPSTDAAGWNHWDHSILPHWNAVTREKFKHDVKYVPPHDIGAMFYPQAGPYSSADPNLVAQHMSELQNYVVVVSWWGDSRRENSKDSQGYSTDLLMPLLFSMAERYGAQIAVHLEPYPGRSEITVKQDLKYLIDSYGSSPALYRDENTNLPVVYLYDSYLTNPEAWRRILDKNGVDTIRGTSYDALLLGLYVNKDSETGLVDSKFDGFYTYFAAEGFTHGSTMRNWPEIARFARSKGLKFSLSVGPGYDDRRIRPWNAENTRDRANGRYYNDHWQAAVNEKPDFVSITSFNEWMEGTQIEPVIPKTIERTIYDGKPFTYLDYGDLGQDYYLEKTHEWASRPWWYRGLLGRFLLLLHLIYMSLS